MVSIDLEINAPKVLGGVFGCTMTKKGIPRKNRVRYVLRSEMKALRISMKNKMINTNKINGTMDTY